MKRRQYAGMVLGYRVFEHFYPAIWKLHLREGNVVIGDLHSACTGSHDDKLSSCTDQTVANFNRGLQQVVPY